MDQRGSMGGSMVANPAKSKARSTCRRGTAMYCTIIAVRHGVRTIMLKLLYAVAGVTRIFVSTVSVGIESKRSSSSCCTP